MNICTLSFRTIGSEICGLDLSGRAPFSLTVLCVLPLPLCTSTKSPRELPSGKNIIPFETSALSSRTRLMLGLGDGHHRSSSTDPSSHQAYAPDCAASLALPSSMSHPTPSPLPSAVPHPALSPAPSPLPSAVPLHQAAPTESPRCLCRASLLAAPAPRRRPLTSHPLCRVSTQPWIARV